MFTEARRPDTTAPVAVACVPEFTATTAAHLAICAYRAVRRKDHIGGHDADLVVRSLNVGPGPGGDRLPGVSAPGQLRDRAEVGCRPRGRRQLEPSSIWTSEFASRLVMRRDKVLTNDVLGITFGIIQLTFVAAIFIGLSGPCGPFRA